MGLCSSSCQEPRNSHPLRQAQACQLSVVPKLARVRCLLCGTREALPLVPKTTAGTQKTSPLPSGSPLPTHQKNHHSKP